MTLLLNTTADLAANQIAAEVVVVNQTVLQNSSLIFLQNSPFFGKDFQIQFKDTSGVVTNLVKDIHYKLVAQWASMGQLYGGLWGAVHILDATLIGTWYVSYRALGGNAVIAQDQLIYYFNNLSDASISNTVLTPSVETGLGDLDARTLTLLQPTFSVIKLIATLRVGAGIKTSANPVQPATTVVDQQAREVAGIALKLADSALQSIPVAGIATLGVIKIGSSLTISPDGTVDVAASTQVPVTSVNGKSGIVNIGAADIVGLGSAAMVSTTTLATSAQGTKADAAVQSVNGKTGNNVSLSASDLGALSKIDADVFYASRLQGNLATSAVQSINGKTGTVITLTSADVGAATAAQGALAATAYQKPNAGIPATDLVDGLQQEISLATTAIQSINGKTGHVVTLNAGDVGALTKTDADVLYASVDQGAKADTAIQVVPLATNTTPGLIKPGIGLSITQNGTLNCTINNIENATTDNVGLIQLAGDLAGTATAPTVPGLMLKQDTLVSGNNIKTIFGKTILGNGNIIITAQDVGAATAAQGLIAESAYQKPVGGITQSDLSSGVVNALNFSSTAVQSINGKTGNNITLSVYDLGGMAQTDADARYSSHADGAKALSAVQSVNGRVGNNVNLIPSDIGALSVLDGDGRYAPLLVSQIAASAVQSVNGKNGNAVTLSAVDVGALTRSDADSIYASKDQGIRANTAIQSINGKTGVSVNVSIADLGGISTDLINAANGLATLDQNRSLISSQLPNKLAHELNFANKISLASDVLVNIGAAPTNSLYITGTDTIFGFDDMSSGAVRILTFHDSLKLVHSANSLILPGHATITTSSGDVAVMESQGAGVWVCISYTRSNGLPVVSDTGSVVKSFNQRIGDVALTKGDVQAVVAQTVISDIGSYALLRTISGIIASAGQVVDGLNLAYTNANGDTGQVAGGTWRCMGQLSLASGKAASQTTLFLKVS